MIFVLHKDYLGIMCTETKSLGLYVCVSYQRGILFKINS